MKGSLMKKLVIVLLSGMLFAACSPKEAEFSMVDPGQCQQEQKLANAGEFQAMTVENLLISQQEDRVFVTFDVRAYCNSSLTLQLKEKEVKSDVVLHLINQNNQSSDCVCIKRVSGNLDKLPEGTYTLKIMDAAGQTLYASKNITTN